MILNLRYAPAVVAAAFAATLMGGTTVTATSGAHFMSGTTDSVASNGALVVAIDEAGVGNLTVDYTVTANATATYACINGGDNHPKAANKATFAHQLSGGASFSPINGRVHDSFSVGPLSSNGFSCPSGQTLVLAAVSYSNVALTDTTNGVSIRLPDRSATFFAV